MNKLTIKFNEIGDVGFIAIRRAYAFMGFGINAAENPEQNRVVLPGIGRPHIFPEEVSKEDLKKLKAEFKTWITGNALRELVEGFEQYLREVFHALIRTHLSKNIALDVKNLIRGFENVGIGGKIDLIREQFKVEIPTTVDFAAINLARNSLTHGHGYIRPRDCNEEGALVMQWRVIEIWVDSNNDEKISLKTNSDEPILLEAGGNVMIRPINQHKKFELKSRLDLTPKELEELCFACQLFVGDLQHNLVKVLQDIGITVNIKNHESAVES